MTLLAAVGQIAVSFSDDRGPFGWNEPTWVAASAVAAILAALATGLLALLTWRLASATRKLAADTHDLDKASAKEREQVERHHQQSLMPIITVNLKCYRGPDEVFAIGRISNIGKGPATNITITIRPSLGPPGAKNLGALGAETSRYLSLHWKHTIEPGDTKQSPYTCTITFKSIFGTQGLVVEQSYSGLADDADIAEYTWPSETSEREITTYFRQHVIGQVIGAFGGILKKPPPGYEDM